MHGNHLHDFIDSLKKPNGVVPRDAFADEMRREKASRLLRSLPDVARQAVCFTHPLCDIPEVDIHPDLSRLPFPVCWFEFSDEEGVPGAFLCFEQPGVLFRFALFVKRERQWIFGGYMSAAPVEEGARISIKGHIGSVQEFRELDAFIGQLFSYLTALNCTNVRRIEHTPKPSSQSVRRALGRQPLFSTWTLELDLSRGAAASEENGGTHASPRIHLRRGHARQYMPGKYCWVQPHVVGNKALGVVHKDYATSSK